MTRRWASWRAAHGRAALVALAVASFVRVPAAGAQVRLGTSREQFFAASPAIVDSLLRPVPIDTAEALGALVLAQLPALRRFYGFSVPVRWTDRGGSVSHPGTGIALDRRALLYERDSVGASAMDDVVRFIVAHEFAHMQQHRRLPAKVMADSMLVRIVECDADLWAGAAVVNSMVDLGVSLADLTERMRRAQALAYLIGEAAWEDERLHPRPDQRMACSATGFNAGMHLRLIREYERTRSPRLLAEIRAWQQRDPTIFGVGDDPVEWSFARATALVHQQVVPRGGQVDFIAVFRKLASAAERGPEVLARDAALLKPPDADRCDVERADGEVALVCAYPPYPSDAIAKDYFASVTSMLQFALESLGWRRTTQSESPTRACFEAELPGKVSCLELSAPQRRLTLTFRARQ